MKKIIAVHSYKGGTGKTLMSTNLAAIYAMNKHKVALFDMDFRAPSLHAIFKVNTVKYWLNDYLNGVCNIENVIVKCPNKVSDNLYLALANPSTEAIREMAAKDRKWEMKALGRLLSLRNTLLNDMEFDYPDFCEYFVIGETVGGRDIPGLKVTANVSTPADKPEMVMISTIHGDEPVGYEFIIAFIESLMVNYGSDPTITRVVDSVELYFIPLLNPDGYIAGTRRNANGLDLNRNFPVPDGGIGDDGTLAEEIETQDIKNFLSDGNGNHPDIRNFYSGRNENSSDDNEFLSDKNEILSGKSGNSSSINEL